MNLSDDCINYIMTLDVNLKFSMAQLNHMWNTRASQYVQPIKSAIYDADYFTISRCPNWIDNISLRELCEIGNEFLVCKYISQIPMIIMTEAMYGAGRSGKLEIVKLIAAARNYCSDVCREYMSDTISWEHALIGAISKNKVHLIQQLLETKQSFGVDIQYDWDTILYAGYKYYNIDVIMHSINQGGYICPNSLLLAACYSGSTEIINIAITEGASDWDQALEMVCEAGNLELLKILLDPDNTKLNKPVLNPNYDRLLYCACAKNQPIIIDFLQNKVTSYDFSLVGAYAGGNLELAKHFISLGATHTSQCVIQAYVNNRPEMIDFYIKNSLLMDTVNIAIGTFLSSDFNTFKKLFLCSSNYEPIVVIAAHNICRLTQPEYKKFIKNPKPLLGFLNLDSSCDFNSLSCSVCSKNVSEHI